LENPWGAAKRLVACHRAISGNRCGCSHRLAGGGGSGTRCGCSHRLAGGGGSGTRCGCSHRLAGGGGSGSCGTRPACRELPAAPRCDLFVCRAEGTGTESGLTGEPLRWHFETACGSAREAGSQRRTNGAEAPVEAISVAEVGAEESGARRRPGERELAAPAAAQKPCSRSGEAIARGSAKPLRWWRRLRNGGGH